MRKVRIELKGKSLSGINVEKGNPIEALKYPVYSGLTILDVVKKTNEIIEELNKITQAANEIIDKNNKKG